MIHLAFLLLSLVLCGGFLFLTQYEARRGVRVYATERDRLDERVRHLEVIVTHVDLAGFIRAEVRHLATRVGHDIAHLSLQLVRTVERLLTRVVKYLRMHHMSSDVPPRESAREFVKTLSAFKDDLKATHPDPEV